WAGWLRVFRSCTIRACEGSGRTAGPYDHGMANFIQRNRRLPLLGCMIMVVVFAVVGVIVLVGVVVTVLVAGDDSSSTSGVETTPGSSTTAPVTGGWSEAGWRHRADGCACGV